jgi:hypothetical protein
LYKKLVLTAYGILATLYFLVLLLPLTKSLVNDGGDLIVFVPLLWLTIPLTAFIVWHFILKGKDKK